MGKLKASSAISVNISELYRIGAMANEAVVTFLCSGISFGVTRMDEILLVCYRIGGLQEQQINLDPIPCPFGGYRYFFNCPQCMKRIGVLYFTKGLLLCRRCSDVVYDVTTEGTYDRMIRRSQKLRKKLGADMLAFGQPVKKPKNMHWSVYWKLVDELVRHEQRMATIVATTFGLIKNN